MLDKNEINSRLKKSLQSKIPKLKCIISGIERTTSMNYLSKKIEKFGSIENFLKHYISSDALKLLKEGRDINEINKTLNTNYISVDLNIINEAKKYYGI
jgi:CRISPR/Cas system CMR-associated protein Cmr5 small subunit